MTCLASDWALTCGVHTAQLRVTVGGTNEALSHQITDRNNEKRALSNIRCQEVRDPITARKEE
jgi:hypothetical protein